MSLKDNIDMVKEELNSEEKFFEKAVVTEKFIKKYKNVLIGSVIAVVLFAVANVAYEMNEKSKLESVNKAFAKLSANPKDGAALNEIKSLSSELHDAWIFSQAVANKDMESLKGLKDTKALIVSDLAEYEMATDEASLQKYASRQDAIFRDLALVQSAVLLLNANKIQEARDALAKVSKGSSMEKLVAALMHYGVK
ncbi:MAG: hypothetical protein PHX44_06695 [Sulfurimonas sp.]|uniref:hypothetical protein n=1 Tax=Sulfurimonas sp. TaxID=2022749 RepID=UPI0026390520|nr:hypothetical protein [Sulfurimonas sp.]MDD2652719.1 hypothetical protein [Sulfurimonas sp.]MDD3450647.1 hypothetical protein [Sulfurimonas sp.]